MKRKYHVVMLLFAVPLFCACSDDVSEEVKLSELKKLVKEWVEDTDSFVKAKGVALLDLTARNGEKEDGSEDGRNLYSAKYTLEVAGVPFFVTKSLEKAMEENGVILFSSPVRMPRSPGKNKNSFPFGAV